MAEAERDATTERLGAERDLFSFPERSWAAQGCPCSTPKAGSSARRWRTTRVLGTSSRGTKFVNTPHHTKGALFRRSRHLVIGMPKGCSRPCTLDEELNAEGKVRKAGSGLLPQAHELPDAQPDLQRSRTVLP